MASALPATSGTAAVDTEDDDSPWLAAADTAAGPLDSAHVATTEAKRDRALIFALCLTEIRGEGRSAKQGKHLGMWATARGSRLFVNFHNI